VTRLVDLTNRIDDDTPPYPGDPETEVDQHATVEEDGYSVKRLSFSSHVSTHLDAPAHMVEDGKTLDDYPVDHFVGEAVAVDVRGQETVEPDLTNVGDVDMVFLRTGHVEKAYGEDAYYDDHPVVAEETAHALVDAGVKILGLDSPSPDTSPYPVHEILLGNDVLILENLTNLDAVSGERFVCHALPLNVADADGAPCRVVAVME